MHLCLGAGFVGLIWKQKYFAQCDMNAITIAYILCIEKKTHCVQPSSVSVIWIQKTTVCRYSRFNILIHSFINKY